MNLEPAENFATFLAPVCAMDLEQIEEFVRQIQANALRFSATFVLASPDDCCCTSDALDKMANQLHPLPEKSA